MFDPGAAAQFSVMVAALAGAGTKINNAVTRNALKERWETRCDGIGASFVNRATITGPDRICELVPRDLIVRRTGFDATALALAALPATVGMPNRISDDW